MLNLLTELLRGKKTLVLGYGREGRSTFRLLQKLGVCGALDIADIRYPADAPGSGTRIYSGENYLDSLEQYDYVFKTPGIVLPRPVESYRCAVTSQTELFLRAYRNQVIGVTGTKGKSTVSSLLHHVLDSAGVPCLLAGNIGTPVFDIAEQVKRDTVVVLELSCHQLEYSSVSPALALFLNLYEDHLDHYGTFEKYARAKENIYRHQYPLDSLYCLRETGLDGIPSRVFYIEEADLPFTAWEDVPGTRLRGAHNLRNAAFVYDVCRPFGVTDAAFLDALKTFTPLRHRMEWLGTKDGVDYYDDSISTTIESTMSAVKSIPNTGTVLLGGMDRGIHYQPLVDFLLQSEVSTVILMYESGKRMEKLFRAAEPFRETLRVLRCDNLAEAVSAARSAGRAGTACVLSPAAASYGDFKNFEERGDRFRTLLFGGGA